MRAIRGALLRKREQVPASYHTQPPKCTPNSHTQPPNCTSKSSIRKRTADAHPVPSVVLTQQTVLQSAVEDRASSSQGGHGKLCYLPTRARYAMSGTGYRPTRVPIQRMTGLYSVTVSYLPMRRVVLIWFTMMITAALCSYARVIQCSGRPYHASTHTELTSSSPYGATATGPEERDGKDCASGKCSRP
eukprot:729676-Rhodomonas_salina.1